MSLKRYVLWGKELPVINIYDSEWILIDEWRFTLEDNIKMGFRNIEIIDSKNEMESGLIRKRIRGYRFYTDFSIQNLENRALLIFLRKMWMADHVVITPHEGTMVNPLTHDYNFEMLINSDFNPEYLENRWIGHTISFTLESVYLLDSIPEDKAIAYIILATTKRVAGVTSADPQTSLTFPN
ncbi:unnamed protein product, partial [marine sediment metagenome]